jgi:hypothetical protein
LKIDQRNLKVSRSKYFNQFQFFVCSKNVHRWCVFGLNVLGALLLFITWCCGIAGAISEWTWSFQCLILGYGASTANMDVSWPFFIFVALGWIVWSSSASSAFFAIYKMSTRKAKWTIFFLIGAVVLYGTLLILAVFRKGALSSTSEADFEDWHNGYTRQTLSDRFGDMLIIFGLAVPIEAICLFITFHFLGKLKTVSKTNDQVKEIEMQFQNTNKRLQAAEKKAAKAERLAAKEAAAAQAATLELQRQSTPPVSQRPQSTTLNRVATYDEALTTADAYKQADALAAMPVITTGASDSSIFSHGESGSEAAAFGSRPASEYRFEGALGALVAPSSCRASDVGDDIALDSDEADMVRFLFKNFKFVQI